jgi:hypothetical protein
MPQPWACRNSGMGILPMIGFVLQDLSSACRLFSVASFVQIGFVFHRHSPLTFSPNPFSGKHLVSTSRPCKLALFRTKRSPMRHHPDPPASPSLALFCTIARRPSPPAALSRLTELGLFRTIAPASHALGTSSRPVPPEIGFVSPVLFAGPLNHNAFSANHLPFVLLWPKLGLFGAEAQGTGAERAGVTSLTPIPETRSDLTHGPVDFWALARWA